MHNLKRASLILDDGTVFRGKSFGYEKPVAGEVVFNTAMTGYPESLTDPSYEGQILVFTYPLIGNYGVPARDTVQNLSAYYESEKIHVEAVVISDYSFEYSHWNADKSLAQWLQEEHIAGICDIDTRALTKHLRERGSMKGKIVIDGGEDIAWVDPNLYNLVARVSCKDVIEYGNSGKRVVLVDCGVKHNILRCLLRRGVTVIRVPWTMTSPTCRTTDCLFQTVPATPPYATLLLNIYAKLCKIPTNLFSVSAWVTNSCREPVEHKYTN